MKLSSLTKKLLCSATMAFAAAFSFMGLDCQAQSTVNALNYLPADTPVVTYGDLSALSKLVVIKNALKDVLPPNLDLDFYFRNLEGYTGNSAGYFTFPDNPNEAMATGNFAFSANVIYVLDTQEMADKMFQSSSDEKAIKESYQAFCNNDKIKIDTKASEINGKKAFIFTMTGADEGIFLSRLIRQSPTVITLEIVVAKNKESKLATTSVFADFSPFMMTRDLKWFSRSEIEVKNAFQGVAANPELLIKKFSAVYPMDAMFPKEAPFNPMEPTVIRFISLVDFAIYPVDDTKVKFVAKVLFDSKEHAELALRSYKPMFLSFGQSPAFTEMLTSISMDNKENMLEQAITVDVAKTIAFAATTYQATQADADIDDLDDDDEIEEVEVIEVKEVVPAAPQK